MEHRVEPSCGEIKINIHRAHDRLSLRRERALPERFASRAGLESNTPMISCNIKRTYLQLEHYDTAGRYDAAFISRVQ